KVTASSVVIDWVSARYTFTANSPTRSTPAARLIHTVEDGSMLLRDFDDSPIHRSLVHVAAGGIRGVDQEVVDSPPLQLPGGGPPQIRWRFAPNLLEGP